ncbi:hypothetical protein AB990_09635 [Alkalihalobacillus pseudalcaliphilus]|nr:hypothetical protein [Alkalihalobacillus pseudalcaliphilus]KMK76614.1 hypothetical protein AB990_09635 [Alkalihalobacillus pseudalcaliphilus]
MECLCENNVTTTIKVEGDVGADPIWCQHCGCNLELDDFPVSSALKQQLAHWGMEYGEWIDWQKDVLLPNGIRLEEQHNQAGFKLTEKIKSELQADFHVIFSPSSSARMYANKW